jgi:hypothetical protein
MPSSEDLSAWFQPRSGDLLRDVLYLDERLSTEANPEICSIYARATIIMGFAAIEAATNDALATIHELLTQAVPAARKREPPWRHFAGRSARRVDSLLRRGTFPKKRAYLLGQIARTTGNLLTVDMIQAIERLRDYRNRIVHMSYARRPERYAPMLDAERAKNMAAEASGCARGYLDFVSREFSTLRLPIPTLRPPSAPGK